MYKLGFATADGSGVATVADDGSGVAAVRLLPLLLLLPLLMTMMTTAAADNDGCR